MDEERFQEINDLKYDLGFEPYEDHDGRKRCLIKHGISEEEAEQYVERFKHGGNIFKNNFGPEKLLDALLTLDLHTSNINLKRIRNRLQQKVDANLEDVPILLPNGKRPLFEVDWSRSWAVPIDHTLDEEYLAALKLLGMSVDDIEKLDHKQYLVSPGTILTLEMSDGTCHVVLPLGKIHPKQRVKEGRLEIEMSDGSYYVPLPPRDLGPNSSSLETFVVLYVLDTREVWVAAPHSYYEEDEDEEDVDPRIERFPGMDEYMSLGVLSRFFTDDVSLQIKDTGYFHVRHAMRFQGKIYAIRNQEAVNVA